MADENQSLTWLHISDFHFKAGPSFDRDLVLNALLSSVKRFADEGVRPDLIFCTGDIGNTGSKTEYENATMFLRKLVESVGLSTDRLFVVPGNHDVDRKVGSKLLRSLSSRVDSDEYFSGSEILLHVSLKQKNFSEWYNEFFDGVRRFDETCTCSVHSAPEINSYRLGVVLINTALFSLDDSDHGKLRLGRPCLERMETALKGEEHDLVVALMHHPMDWLADDDRAFSVAKVRSAADVILRGHLHSTDAEQISGIGGDALHLAAGACYQTSERPNRAMYVTLRGREVHILPIRYETDPVPVWTLDPSVYPASPYTRAYPVGKGAIGSEVQGSPPQTAKPEDGGPDRAELAKVAFEEDLFETPAGEILYAEPRLMTQPQDVAFMTAVDPEPVTVDQIVNSSDSYVIEARAEHGASNLARRLVAEFSKQSAWDIYHESAPDLPGYKNKLAPRFAQPVDGRKSVLVLDNFNVGRHDRLLKELVGLGTLSKIVIFVSDQELRQSVLLSGDNQALEFIKVYMWPLGRKEIRLLSAPFFKSSDEDLISSVVDKVYDDLLALCIPLTPANVIMYLRILNREDDFYPINRVDIVDRYLNELLRRPSDSYKGSFNSKNKIEIVSAFVADLFDRQAGSFTDYDWHKFCRSYSEKTLSSFDPKALLEELASKRVFVELQGRMYLKYSFFYSYFLGRFIAHRPERTTEFVDQKKYFDVDSVVEVVTGLGVDNTRIVEALCEDLDGYLAQFSDQYIPKEFNPYAGARWAGSKEDGEKFWGTVERQIEEGPRNAKEIDVIKSSIVSEARTADQAIRFDKFEEVKQRLFLSMSLLTEALKNSDTIDGNLKRRSIRLIYEAYFASLQLGTILAPAIAQQRIVQWGGLAFFNDRAALGDEDHKKTIAILNNLNDALARKGSEVLGSTKLGEVFKSFSQVDSLSEFERLMNFSCVLASKPTGWAAYLRKMIEETDRNAFYLHGMLRSLMKNFRNDVNLQKDRAALKELIALVRAKRDFGRNTPGAKVVSDMLKFLEKTDQFSGKSAPADEDQAKLGVGISGEQEEQ